MVKKSKTNIKEDMKEFPPFIRKMIEGALKSTLKVRFPVVTLREDNWIVATTPIIDVSAQGKTEEDAVNNLKAMIDDYMSDPDTLKPEIKSIVNMEIGIKTMPITIPIKRTIKN